MDNRTLKTIARNIRALRNSDSARDVLEYLRLLERTLSKHDKLLVREYIVNGMTI